MNILYSCRGRCQVLRPFIILSLAMGIGATVALSVQARENRAARSAWVHPGPGGKLAYQTTPSGDHILDFSYAGYKGGGVALPSVPVKRTIVPLGNGQDDTAQIQAAVDAVSALPQEGQFRGAVLLKPGTYRCAGTIHLAADGVVLRGSGAQASTLLLTGTPHGAIQASVPSNGRTRDDALPRVQTTLADAYVPSGAASLRVTDATGFAAGNTIAIVRPVTPEWVKFMHMDDLTRDGKPQTWLKAGSATTTERRITALSGNTILLDVPLSDSFDARYLNPPGTLVRKITPPARLREVGIEDLHIESPPQAISHTQAHFTALRLNGEDCWVRNVICDETMNSVAVGGQRITLEQVTVHRTARHQGSSKPAEFAPNGSQVLLDRCSVTGDNLFFIATGGGVSGPVVILNSTFHGQGNAESHQRWSTGILYDNCRLTNGGIELRNRGAMGSGHGWTMGWGVVWNCVAKDYIVQDPPGARNWVIGCIGANQDAARPFDKGPVLPGGTIDSPGKPVAPQSLYLTQLAQRLGPQAVRNLGYATENP